MFEQHVRSMRQSIDRLLLRPRIPRHVYILQEQAEYLKVPFRRTVAQNTDKSWGSLAGEEYGPLVKVKLSELYRCLQGATGVNARDEDKRNAEQRSLDSEQRAAETSTLDPNGRLAAEDSDHDSGDQAGS